MKNAKGSSPHRGYKGFFKLNSIMKFQFLIKTQMLKNKDFIAFKLSYVSFIMLTNVKMSTTILKCQLLLLAFKHLRAGFHAQVS